MSDFNDGMLYGNRQGFGGTGWSSTQMSNANGYNLHFNNMGGITIRPSDTYDKASGLNVRCVQ